MALWIFRCEPLTSEEGSFSLTRLVSTAQCRGKTALLWAYQPVSLTVEPGHRYETGPWCHRVTSTKTAAAQGASVNHAAPSFTFVFYAQNPHSGWHISVNKNWNYRSQKKARLVHLGTFLAPGIICFRFLTGLVFAPVLVGVGACLLDFKVRMVPPACRQLC